MKVVGVRELKNRLSEYIRRVRAGEEILVTDRGEVVAELAPPRRPALDPKLPPGLATLVKRGAVVLGGSNEAAHYPALKKIAPEGTSARLLDEERGEC